MKVKDRCKTCNHKIIRDCCQQKDFIKTAYREYKCKHCGKVWFNQKCIDASGNYEFELIPKE